MEPKDELKAHPDYREGFDDAVEGDPLFDTASEAYRAGWEAAHRVKEILRRNGFTEEDDGSFSKRMVIPSPLTAPNERK